MNFMDAVLNMRSGKRLARVGWGASQCVCIMPNQSYMWAIASTSKPMVNATIYTASLDDIEANDWIVRTN